MKKIKNFIKQNIKKIIIFTSPIILFIDIYLFGLISDMMRQPSDITVVIGTILFTVFIIFNYYLIVFIKSKFKN
jgi:hypothetical protein